MNIILHYLYRDASNYKRHNAVVFSNPDNLSPAKIDACIRSALIDGEWFLHCAWNVPDMHFVKHDWNNDHPLHEYNCVEFTDDAVTQSESIATFLARIAAVSTGPSIFNQ